MTSTLRFFGGALLALAGNLAIAQSMQMQHDHGSHGNHGDSGSVGNAAKVTRTIKVDMRDNMRFTPEQIKVKAGETVRFVVTNSGKLKHEIVFGTETELKSHYAAMLKNPEMEHADDNQLTLEGGKSGDMIRQFSNAGTVSFACLQPGHYDAGMKGSVIVAANAHQH